MSIGRCITLALLVACQTPPFFVSNSQRLLFDQGKLTEGPAVDAQGNLYFSDQPNDVIRRISPRGEVSVFMQPSGVANGLAFDREGRLLICQSNHGGYPGDSTAAKRRVVRREPDGSITILAAQYKGQPFLGPNDLCVDQQGRIYFTDPYYPESGTAKTQPTSGVYRIDPDGTLTQVVADLQKPNGILITPDNQTIFISDRGTQQLHRYRVQLDGSLEPVGVVYQFTGRGIDGMAMDVDGNIYGAAGEGEQAGVYVIDPDKKKLLTFYAFPEKVYNVCFGRETGHTLYVCSGGSVYQLQTEAKGIVLPIQ